MKHTKESLKLLLKQHKTFSAMADAIGVSRQNIYQLCKKHGLASVISKVRRRKV